MVNSNKDYTRRIHELDSIFPAGEFPDDATAETEIDKKVSAKQYGRQKLMRPKFSLPMMWKYRREKSSVKPDLDARPTKFAIVFKSVRDIV
jgi:hypothetical protein